MLLKDNNYISIIKNTLKNDLNETGDVTSEAIFKDEKANFILIAKDKGIFCGKEIFYEVFKQVDKTCKVECYFKDGEFLKKGALVARIYGKVLSILKAERTALNFISHLSGIATKTNKFVNETEGKLKILDTRKTIPGIRMLQKYAVACGGGINHRIGLYDMVLIKDNHIDAAGSITNAVNKVRDKWKNKYKIEVETRNMNEVKEALNCKVDRIMLDNMDISKMKEAVKFIDHKAEVEASGNVTFNRLKDIASTGVNYVSIGELTHTIEVFDFSLKKEQ